MSLRIFLDNEAATKIFATDLAMALKKGDFIALKGDLGAGKSTLARSLIRTLAQDMTLDVPSPTFSLLQHYECDFCTITHADLYRLTEAQEIEELGLIEMMEQGVLLVEWPQQAAGLLPEPTFDIMIDYAPTGRQLVVTMPPEASVRLERSLEIRAFLENNGAAQAQRYYLAGDASSRRYETIIASDNTQQWVLMDAAQMHPNQESSGQESSGQAQNYAQMVHLAQDVRQFVGLTRLIRDKGFAAPHIFASDLKANLLLLEHLGDEGIIDAYNAPIKERYLVAAEILADFHAQKWPKQKDWPDLTLKIPPYDRPTLHREVNLLLDWYLPYHLNRQVSAAMRQDYSEIWDRLIDRLHAAEQGLCLRDYHSPNLLWRPHCQGHERLGLIDFQDALIGPLAYDVASLAQDARIFIEPELERAILDTYCTRRQQHDAAFDEVGLRNIYAIAAMQRLAKILGLFVRLDQRDGKPDYLKNLPHLLDYLARNLAHPDLHELRDFCLIHKIL